MSIAQESLMLQIVYTIQKTHHFIISWLFKAVGGSIGVWLLYSPRCAPYQCGLQLRGQGHCAEPPPQLHSSC